MVNTIIAGAGITGLSCGYHLKKNDFIIFEKEHTPGGLCRSLHIDGFTFDYTGHLIHLRDSYVTKLVLGLLKDNIDKIKRNAWIYSSEVYTRYPFQANLYGLPKNIIRECIIGLLETYNNEAPRLKSRGFTAESRASRDKIPDVSISFHNWVLNTFGKGLAKYFFFPYNRKLWNTPLKNITTDWVNMFVPKPSLSEVITGAFTDQKKLFGYNSYFYYPKTNGIQSLIDAFSSKLINNIKTDSEILNIDWKNKLVIKNNGDRIRYKHFVSTMPLIDLLNNMINLPHNLKNQINILKYNSIYCVNLGVRNTNKTGNNKHWAYFPENEFIFYRVGFYHNICRNLAPGKSSSMYVEVSCKNANNKTLLDRTFTGLEQCKLIENRKHVSNVNVLHIPYAYIIHDKNRSPALRLINDFLLKNNIYSIGRFGAWKYSYMEESILDGKKTAELIQAQ